MFAEEGDVVVGEEEEEVKLACCVMLQKELPEGVKDEECGRPVDDGNAGLCK